MTHFHFVQLSLATALFGVAGPGLAQSSGSADQNYPTIEPRGRVQLEALVINEGDDPEIRDEHVRRLYLGVQGTLSSRISYQAEADFTDGEVTYQDTLLRYVFDDRTELAAGYIKPAISEDNLTSDVYTVFLERSAFAGLFSPGRRIGVGISHRGDDWGLNGGVYGDRDASVPFSAASESFVASARAHADLLPGNEVLHVALSSYYIRPSNEGGGVRLSQSPETSGAATVVDTGRFLADRGVFVGAEAGYGDGPVTLQVEGGVLDYKGPVTDPRFYGASAQISWRLTGEDRPYSVKSGVFGRVSPLRPIDQGGPGAFEAGLRMTYVDLDDGPVKGGELSSYSAVLNWYPVEHVRFSANYVHSETMRAAGNFDQDLVAVRAAYDW